MAHFTGSPLPCSAGSNVHPEPKILVLFTPLGAFSGLPYRTGMLF
jgi:hypothetical protein